MGKTLGIDLGTTNSCVAVREGDKTIILENSEGARTTPSVVAFTKNGEILVGQAAKRQAVTNPKNTVFSAKRLIGRKYSELTEEDMRVPYELVEAENGDVRIRVELGGEQKVYSPQEISAQVLSKLKRDAEAKLGEKVQDAVITVPAYFNDSQRKATKEAGEIAGLNVVRIVNEPTAAALAYGLDAGADASSSDAKARAKGVSSEKIVVYDLGGGTFDVSVLEISEGVFQVLSTNGDTHLGGDDWDNAIMKWLIDGFKETEGVDLSNQTDAVQRIKEEAEKAKIALSSSGSYDISLPFISMDTSGPKHLQATLTRAKLDELTEDLLARTEEPVNKAVTDAFGTVRALTDGTDYVGDDGERGVTQLVLVGGMTRNPAVQEKARELAGMEPHKGLNPDEVVAAGAALQGGVVNGEVSDILLLDVTPLTLCTDVVGDRAVPMIKRNTTIPASFTDTFTTCCDYQTQVKIAAAQGESRVFSQNKFLGSFLLTDIERAPQGVPQIEVTFDIDANGILKVTARDKKTGCEKNIVIQGASGLTEEEVENARRDTAAQAAAAQERERGVDARNEAEALLREARRAISEKGGAASKDAVRAVSRLETAMNAGEDEKLPGLCSELKAALAAVSAQASDSHNDGGETVIEV